MKIGTVIERVAQEFRVGITPNSAKEYIEAGHEVYIESNAGLNCGFTNKAYEEVGCKIINDTKELWESVDMVVKVKEPISDEFKYFRENLIIFSYMHLSSHKDLFEALINNKVTAIAYETIQTDDKRLPCLEPMSEIAGRVAVIEGSKYLQSTHGGVGKLITGTTGVSPADILIIGAGNAGLGALKVASGLGANVTIVDISNDKLSDIKKLFPYVNTLISNEDNISATIKNVDLTISTVSLPGDKTPQIIKSSYYKEMRPGSVIVDVAIDQGGSTNDARVTSLKDPIYIREGIIHFSVPNIPSSVHLTATLALNNATLSYGLEIANNGLKDISSLSNPLKKGFNTYHGNSTNEIISDVFNYEYKPLIK